MALPRPIEEPSPDFGVEEEDEEKKLILVLCTP
jgi:hypothetical protein